MSDILTLTEQLITGILQKLPGQTFSIKRIRKLWTPEEEKRFEKELEYLTEKYSLDRIIDGYFYMTNSNMEESKYFHEHGHYRYSSFAEVDRSIYADEDQMTLYMLGLSLTEYLWETVLKIHRFYEKAVKSMSGDKYLEIGPGHGKYFLEAYNLGNFKEYVAVDVSQTAIDMTEEYMKRYAKHHIQGGGIGFYVKMPLSLMLIQNMTLSWHRKFWSILKIRLGCLKAFLPYWRLMEGHML